MIRRSRLLFSSPPKFKPNNVSDLEKLQLQKVTRSSLDPADEHAKKGDTDSNTEVKQATDSETQSDNSDIKEPSTSTKDPTLIILNHNFPGITFNDSSSK